MAKEIIYLIIILILPPASYAGEWINIPPNEWKTNIKDWSFIEKELKIKVENEALKRNDPVSDWESYNFQYAYLINNGKKVIYINRFCETSAVQWRTRRVYVMDGGSCLFQAYYDPETNRILNVFINGQA